MTSSFEQLISFALKERLGYILEECQNRARWCVEPFFWDVGISCTARIFKQYISCKVRALYRGWVFLVFLVFVCIVFFLFKLYPLLWGFCIVAHLKTKSVIYNFNSHWFIPSVFPSSSHTHVCPHLLAEFTKSLTEQKDGKWYLYCTIYQLCCFLIQISF